MFCRVSADGNRLFPHAYNRWNRQRINSVRIQPEHEEEEDDNAYELLYNDIKPAKPSHLHFSDSFDDIVRFYACPFRIRRSL
ncbi:Hypothetical predicted protein [Octopus vulgaris]|uniref:Uncharacterized protein n=1 Tax=Octopus vulgaris TaxID=6645 RepID=A0AA36BW96_OCTVU|nr:Hypothetical predicted protein [Octopus vulgaris]